MSQVGQKRVYNKLKHDLEPWRNLIVQLNSVLTWEKNYYPAVVAGTVTALFIGLWALDMSNITMVALIGLIAVIFDFVYPSLSRFLFSPDNWGGQEEASFEQVCGHLCTVKMALANWYEYLFDNKERKSPVFVVSVSVVLLGLAWLGAVVNNMMLMYVMSMTVALYPGLHDKLTLSALKEKLEDIFGKRFQQGREKLKKSD